MRHKILHTTIALLFLSMSAYSQGPPPINQPQASPRAMVSQVIGITNVSIDYGRPAVNGRTIFGELIPFDQVWRAGANENTRISFDRSVIIGNEEIPAGTYGLHIIPTETSSTLILNSDHNSWGSYFYAEENDVVRFEAQIDKIENTVERLTFNFENISNETADVNLYWGNTKITFPINANTEKHMLTYIENEYLKNLAGFFWQGFNGAANYTLVNDASIDQGLLWANRSISMNKNFTNMSTKSMLLRKQGKLKEAESVINEAMPMANEVLVNAYGYGLLFNVKDVDAAIEVFKLNVKDYPKSWNVYDSLAEAYGTKGNKKEAKKNYEKALELAPEAQKQRIKTAIESMNG